MEQRWRLADYSAIFLRLALAAGFLSAVADRFGLWGRSGQPQVAWGNFSNFIAYTERLTAILPMSLGPTLAWAATVAEITLALALLIGWFTRVAAFLSGALLLLFALAMTFSLGIKAPLDFSVYTASAAAFLLADCGEYKLSLDRLIQSGKREPRSTN
jgi:uncharacterized membrane protein YphA (DoxX/SURF4 family)